MRAACEKGARMEALIEKRSWPRKDCLVPAQFSISDTRERIDGYITDISGGGMRLRTSEDIDVSVPVIVGFDLHGSLLRIRAKVRWQCEKILGLEFSRPINFETERNIFSFVNEP